MNKADRLSTPPEKEKRNLYDQYLEGDLDPDGFLGISDARNGFQEIRYQIHFKTKESQEKTEAFAAFVESRCPVGDCLANGVKLINSGVVRD